MLYEEKYNGDAVKKSWVPSSQEYDAFDMLMWQ